MLDDSDGMEKLCISKTQTDGKTTFSVDTDTTIKEWEEFTNLAVNYYGFGSVDLQEDLANERQAIAAEIEAARAENNTEVDTAKLEGDRAALEASITQVRLQPTRLDEIRENHVGNLKDWVRANRSN